MPERANEPRIAVSDTSTLQNRTGSWKYIRPQYQDGVAPCNARCPAGADVEGYLNLVRADQPLEAVELLLREHPMPAITGRVCHHPCESSCNRNHIDEAVAIHAVERALGDLALASRPVAAPRTRPEQIAVIGSGPAGLACAYHLLRLGYGVTVFEQAAEAGGMLRLGIPSYRLPRDVLDRQIAWFSELGMDICCNARFGSAADAELRRHYDAIFFATGAHVERPLGIDGESLRGVMRGLDFLKAVNRGEEPALGDTVAIIGGGNTAIDCARTVLRLGSKAILIYRRTRAEMPAIAAEVDDAIAEGVEFIFLAAPTALERRRGLVVGVQCQRMVLGPPDAGGRRRPLPIDESFIVPADTVLTAVGEATELAALPSSVTHRDGSVVIDALGATAADAIFAGGDVAGITRTVADALGSGKAAAVGIDRMLRGRSGEAPSSDDINALRWAGGAISMLRWQGDDPVARTDPVNEVIGVARLNLAHFVAVPRHEDRHVPLSQRGKETNALLHFAEVNRGLTLLEAFAEARRCCNCGACNQCELCLLLCPDVAISRRADGRGFDIDLDHCKGCGICAAECPRGAIVMTREGL